MRRRFAFVTAVAVALTVGIPPGAVPEDGGWPLSGLLSVLRQPAALADVIGLPEQQHGSDAGDDHYVSAEETRANGGVGRAPGRGVGAVAAEIDEPPAPAAWTAPAESGEHSFDEKTSKRLPEKSAANVDEFLNADGSFTRETYMSRVNYRDADGLYQPIDTDLTRRGDRLEMGANSIDVTLGTTAVGGEATAPPAPSPSVPATAGASASARATPATSASAEASPATSATAEASPVASASASVEATPTVAASAEVTPAAPAAPSPVMPSDPDGSRVESADEALAAVTTASGHTMAYDLAGAADVPAVVDGSVATYREILPDTDLELQTINDGLKETIILNSPAAGNEWVFPMKLEGLTARAKDDGSLELVTAGGTVALRIPAGFMEDSKVDPNTGRPARSTGVTYELIRVDGGPALKVTADAAWLNDPARQYPVRVDPTTVTIYDTGDLFVDNDPFTTDQNTDELRVGVVKDPLTEVNAVSRSLLLFDNFRGEFGGHNIKAARLDLFHTWSKDCPNLRPVYVRRIVQDWSFSELAEDGTLEQAPAFSAPIGTMNITDNSPACNNTTNDPTKGKYRSVDLDPNVISGWATGAIPNYGLALTAAESDPEAAKTFSSGSAGAAHQPKLTVTYDYNEMPQVNEQYPGHGQAAQTLTPTLIADAHDPDNFPKTMKLKFTVYAKDAKTVIATSGEIYQKSWTVPAGKLVWGESYYWEVYVTDGFLNNSRYLIKQLLVTPVPQPAITSSLSQNSGQGFDSVIGNYTTATRDAIINTVGPALEISRSYNSNDPRSGQAFGAGWSSIADAKAVEQYLPGSSTVKTVTLTYPNGREIAFGRNNDGDTNILNDVYVSPTGRATGFSRLADGYRLVEKDGTGYEFRTGSGAGRYLLSSMTDNVGRALTFTHTDGLLSQIKSESSKRSLKLYWTPASGGVAAHVAYVATDPLVPGDWDSVNTWSYEYTGNTLTKVCPPTTWAECHTYQYTQTSRYPAAVANARPKSYWRLTEAAGTPRAVSEVLENGGTDNGDYSSVVLGQPGPLAGSAATAGQFNGTTALVAVPVNRGGDPTHQAISIWFKASRGDGVLYGQSWDQATPAVANQKTTGNYHPTLYIGKDGKLAGGFPTAPTSGSLGSLVAYGQGQCITVPGGSAANSVKITLADCNGATYQQWTLSAKQELLVRTAGNVLKCLDAQGGNVTNGVDIITYDCNNGVNQKWEVRADGKIVGVESGLCLDTVGTGLATEKGAQLQLWACGKDRKADQSFLPRLHTAMQSAVSVADGKWHHVVLSASGNAQQMYLDGNPDPVASQTSVTVQDMSTAYSYIGSGFLGGGWPNQSYAHSYSNQGTRAHVAGSIAEVALFDTPVDARLVQDLWAAQAPVDALTHVTRPSERNTAVVDYDQVSGRVSQVTDGNGTAWRPGTPVLRGTTKVHESAVLGGAPSNYWRMAEAGGKVHAVNQVNGGTAVYNTVTLGSVTGPFQTKEAGTETAASFNGTNSYVNLPDGTMPSGNGSVSMWFNTSTAGALLGERADENTADRVVTPTLWVENGRLRALSPSTHPTGPLTMIWEDNNCLEVQGAVTSTDGNNPVQINTCNGAAAQSWTMYRRTDVAGTYYNIRAFDKCLDVSNSGTANGTKIQLWGCNSGAAQRWVPHGRTLMNPNSGKCLHLPSRSAPDGTDVVLWDCDDQWSFLQAWTHGMSSTTSVTDGKWHHAVLTTSGNTQTLYVDGAKQATTTGPLNLVPPATKPNYLLGVAAHSSPWSDPRFAGSNGRFTGSLAEVAFYPTVLDAAQAAQQFNARDAVNSAPAGEAGYPMVVVGGETDAAGATKDVTTQVVQDLVYGRKVADINGLGNVTRYGYSSKGLLRTVTDANGNMTINEHDVRGNVVSVTTCQDRSENKCSTSYSTYYPNATDPNPPFDLRNDRVVEQRGPGSANASDTKYLTKYTYDAQGNRTSVTDPLDRTTAVTYTTASTPAYGGGSAPAGLPARIVKPDGGVQTFTYYATGDIAETTDPAGMVTRYEYDGLGRTTKEIDVVNGVAGAATTFTHDRLDRVVTVTDPAVTNAVTGATHTPVTTLVYTEDGQLDSETVSDATGGDASRTVGYQYDDFGRRWFEVNELGDRVEFKYDAFGRVIEQIHPDGTVEGTVYDAAGNETEVWAQKSGQARVTVQKMAYDPAGRLASTTDAMGWKSDYDYTDNNLLSTVTRTGGGQSFVMEKNLYDDAGNLISQVTNNNETTTTRTYDGAGRNTSATLDPAKLNRTTTYGYSVNDEVLTTTLQQGATKHGFSETMFDRLGRAVAQTTYLDSADLTPVLRWNLDQAADATVADAAGNSTGSVSGAVTWSTERGGSAVFNGTDGQIGTRLPVIDSTRPYTLAAWVKLGNHSADRVIAELPGDIGASALRLQYDADTGTWQAATAIREAGGGTSWITTPAGSATAGSTWTHLAVTVDPGAKTLKLYVGGAEKSSISDARALNNRATGLTLAPNHGGRFTGLIDDVQAYQKALTAGELGQIAVGTAPAAAAQVSRTSYTLTTDGSVTSVTDPNGNTTTVANDEVGRAVRTTSPAVDAVTGEGDPVRAVAVSRVGYNTFGEVTEQEDPNGNITIARYDGVGRIVQTQLPAYTPPGSDTAITPITVAEYNKVGQVISTTDPLNKTTSYEYDLFGRTTKVTAPDTGVTRYDYNANGELLTHTDPNGAVAAATYDYLGRTRTTSQTVRQTGLTHTTKYAYGARSWPTSVESAAGVITRFDYNAAGEQTKVIDANNKETLTQYDPAGRPVRVEAPDKTHTTVRYDFAGRAVSTADHSAGGGVLRSQSQQYDRAGNPTASIDARGTTRTFRYDAVGQLISHNEPIKKDDNDSGKVIDAIVTSFGYDLAGRQTRFTDGRNNRFITTYNPWGLVASQIEPATTKAPGLADRTFSMAYDAGGRMTRMDSPGGVSVTSEYDEMGRLTKSSGSGAQTATADRTFEYDRAGRITSFTGAAGENTVEYDDRGLVTKIAGVSGASSYEYNGDGALTARTDAAGATAYTYDGLGRLSTLINTTAGVNLTYGYDDLSQLKTISYAGGNKRTFGYNELHQLTSDEMTTTAGASIGKIAYKWNENDQLTEKTTTGFNGASANTYTYDLAGRLTQWDNGTTPVLYDYDKSGNRLQAGTKTFTYDERNQLLSDSAGTSYQYTPRGTLLSTTTNGVTTNTVTDAFNQVVSQGTKTGSQSSYSYDGLGRVIRENFAYTGLGNDLASDGANTYVRDTANSLVGVASGGTQRYAWTDIHTDVVGEFTATGTTLTGSVSYDPWGKILASGGMVGKLGYQQEWTDQGTGKVNMWSRWYDPETGAFDTRDTATNSPTPSSGAANRFAYAEANPMTNTDTTGNAVDGKCGEYDHACIRKQYQAELATYNEAMEERDRGMQAASTQIAAQEAEYLRAERESQTPVIDILIQVGVGIVLDLIGWPALEGCINGSLWDCVDLAVNVLGGPLKAVGMFNSIRKGVEKALVGYRLWQRIVTGAQTAMRQAQNLITQARKHLTDLMQKKPKKPKAPKYKKKPPAKKKPKAKPKTESKPQPSKQAEKPKAETKPKQQDKPKDTKPAKEKKPQKDRERSEDRDRDTEDQKPAPAVKGCHSFDPATRVLMADGTTRPISEVSLGDEVLATDPVTGEQGARPVTLLHSNRDLELTDVTVSDQPADSAKRTVNEGNGDRSTRGPTESVLKTTANHPFWDVTTGEWVNAADLVAGKSTLLGPDGQLQYVTAVRNFTGPKVMRDLTVADIHTYYVIAGDEPVLVHNNDGAIYDCPLGTSAGVPSKPGVYIIELNDGKFYIGSATKSMRTRVNAAGRPATRDRDPHALEKAGYTIADVVKVTWREMPGTQRGGRYIGRDEAKNAEQSVIDEYLRAGRTLINRDYPVSTVGERPAHITPEWLSQIRPQLPHWEPPG